jgi:hypothetical protein
VAPATILLVRVSLRLADAQLQATNGAAIAVLF